MSRIVNNSNKPGYGTLHHVINFFEVPRIPKYSENGMKNISFNANRSARQSLANSKIDFNTRRFCKLEIIKLLILDLYVIALEVNVFESVANLTEHQRRKKASIMMARWLCFAKEAALFGVDWRDRPTVNCRLATDVSPDVGDDIILLKEKKQREQRRRESATVNISVGK